MQSGILNQHDNILTSRLLSQILNEYAQYLNAGSAWEQNILKAFETATPIHQLTNPMVSDNVVLKALKLMKEIKNDMKNIKSQHVCDCLCQLNTDNNLCQ